MRPDPTEMDGDLALPVDHLLRLLHAKPHRHWSVEALSDYFKTSESDAALALQRLAVLSAPPTVRQKLAAQLSSVSKPGRYGSKP